VFITPAVAGERLYIGSCAGSYLALDRATGEIAWSHDTSQDGPSAQFHGDALVTEELVVVGSDARPMGHLYAFDRASGEVRWKIPFPGGVAAELHRYGEAVLAVAMGAEVWAVDLATGHPLWTFEDAPEAAQGARSLDPALAGDRLLVPWRSGAVDALDAATGRHLWRRDLEATLNTSAAVFGGELVVGSQDGRLHRLSPETGEVLGSVTVPGVSYGDLTEAGGCLLALSAEGELDESMQPEGPYHLTCLDPGLAGVRWRHTSNREIGTFRPLAHEGLVIAGGPSLLFALDLADGSLAWQLPVEGVPRGLGASGETLYVGTLSGKVFALPMAPRTSFLPAATAFRGTE
jgi:outer membrane protein assembly factor BamB